MRAPIINGRAEKTNENKTDDYFYGEIVREKRFEPERLIYVATEPNARLDIAKVEQTFKSIKYSRDLDRVILKRELLSKFELPAQVGASFFCRMSNNDDDDDDLTRARVSAAEPIEKRRLRGNRTTDMRLCIQIRGDSGWVETPLLRRKREAGTSEALTSLPPLLSFFNSLHVLAAHTKDA